MEPEFIYLANFLKSHHPFTNSELEQIASVFTLVELNPTDFFIRAGQTVDYVAFVAGGVLCATYGNTKTCSQINYFMPAGHFVSEIHGRYLNQPADMNIRALLPSKLLVAKCEQIEALKQQIDQLENVISAIDLSELVHVVLMQNIAKTKKAENKMLMFKKNFPELVSLLHDKYIATFLGITNVYYSTIKSKIVKQKGINFFE